MITTTTTTTITNATPHPVRILCDVFDALDHAAIVERRADGSVRPAEIVHTEDGPAYYLSAGTHRLAAEASIHGPVLGCGVRYLPTDDAKAELSQLDALPPSHIVICSEISARALWSLARVARLVWPVLAENSIRRPPAERWAKALATHHLPVVNDAGETVGTQAYWAS